MTAAQQAALALLPLVAPPQEADGQVSALKAVAMVGLREELDNMCYNRGNFKHNDGKVYRAPARRLTSERYQLSMATSDATSDIVTLQLTKGYVAVIGVEDADLARFKWTAYVDRNGMVYACRHIRIGKGQPRHERLHRVILSRVLERPLGPKELVDHIDLNALNNRRANLRVATPSQNGMNKTKPKSNTSGYKGVSWNASHGKWAAYIRIDRKQLHLGFFDTPEDAHVAYCIAARELHGEFARSE